MFFSIKMLGHYVNVYFSEKTKSVGVRMMLKERMKGERNANVESFGGIDSLLVWITVAPTAVLYIQPKSYLDFFFFHQKCSCTHVASGWVCFPNQKIPEDVDDTLYSSQSALDSMQHSLPALSVGSIACPLRRTCRQIDLLESIHTKRLLVGARQNALQLSHLV